MAKMITVDEFFKDYFPHVKAGEVILDVRTADEFHAGHIPNAVNISHEQVRARLSEIADYSKLYIYCRRGARAQTAAAALVGTALESKLVCIYDAGMDLWAERGYPVAK